MKRCPACNRTFEDSFTFCLADGSLLSAPFDSQATEAITAENFIPPTLPAGQAIATEPRAPYVPGAPARANALRWAGLLGVIPGARVWKRTFFFFLALSVSDIFWFVLAPTIIRQQPGGEVSYEFFNIPDAWQWVESLLGDLLLALLAALVFGAVRSLLALPLLGIVYTLLITALAYLILRILLMGLPASYQHGIAFWDSFRWFTIARNFLWAVVFFGLVELAVRKIKSLLAALMVGVMATSLVMMPVTILMSPLFLEEPLSTGSRFFYLPFNLISNALLALTFWAGLRSSYRSARVQN